MFRNVDQCIGPFVFALEFLFQKYLQLEMGFFDDPKRSTGVLTSRLSSDASKINGLVGGQCSILMQSLGAMGVGLGIAFWYEWRLTLIIFAFMPFLTIGSSEFIYTVHIGKIEKGSSELHFSDELYCRFRS